MPHLRLIDEDEADGLLKEEYDAAVERAGGISVAVGDCDEALSRVASPRDVRALLADLAELRVTAQ